MRKIFSTILFALLHLCTHAQWSSDPAVNNEVAVQPGSKEWPAMCSDGNGGAIIAWMDFDLGNYAIYAQRINANGNIQWTVDGIKVSASQSTSVALVADGAGGAILVWTTGNINNEDLYAQRINAAGSVQWPANGVVICNAVNTQNSTSIIPDGSNGAIIVWRDERATVGMEGEIFAQKVNSNGSVQWAPNGVKISTTCEYMQLPKLVSDGAGGAIFVWTSGSTGIYCQRINNSGAIQWTLNGVQVCAGAGLPSDADIATDGNGGAFISFQRAPGGLDDHIFVQRILNNGTPQWVANGEIVCNALGYQTKARIIAGSSNSAIITWQDTRTGGADIYAQKINGNSVIAWTQDGVSICSDASIQFEPSITTDGNGGAIIAWTDKRNGATNADIYAQRISNAGLVEWTLDGVAVCSATHDQEFQQIIPDGINGALLTWQDKRHVNNIPKIYAQRIASYGALSISDDELEIAKEINIYPNPANGLLTVDCKIDNLKAEVRNMLGQIVYQKILTSTDQNLNVAGIPAGVYFIELTSKLEAKQFSVVKKIMIE